MRILAPAKINLDFEITGRREDGYHFIRTTMQTVDICDVLDVNIGWASNRVEGMQITGCIVSAPTENILSKARRELEVYTGKWLPVTIHLSKVIPIGAGMGGGSSDAASLLFAINELYHLGLSYADLMTVAERIGADVPFFVTGGRCAVAGAGEQVFSLPPEKGDYIYLIMRPHRRLSSKEAYEEYDKTGKTFYQQALEKCPQLNEVLTMFPDAVLSGKGPTAWVKRDSQRAMELQRGMAEFINKWNGDIFFARPVELIRWS